MPSNRKFYRYTFTYEVLAEREFDLGDFASMADIEHEAVFGDFSGRRGETTVEVVDGAVMARLLQEHASDPEFFQLDEHGNDLED